MFEYQNNASRSNLICIKGMTLDIISPKFNFLNQKRFSWQKQDVVDVRVSEATCCLGEIDI